MLVTANSNAVVYDGIASVLYVFLRVQGDCLRWVPSSLVYLVLRIVADLILFVQGVRSYRF